VFAGAEETARQRDDQVKAQRPAVGARAGTVKRHASHTLHELVAEAALPGARLRAHEHDARPTRPGLAQRVLEPAQLPLAPHEAREATRLRALEAALDRTRSPQL